MMQGNRTDTRAYRLVLPRQWRSCVVYASPHSGREYSDAFRAASVLDDAALRSSEDAFVDILFGTAPGFGAPLLMARAPRAWLDLNRATDELDPALIEGVRSKGTNPRIGSGLGVIPRVVAGGRQIYAGRISRTEAEARIRDYWQPYHDRLEALLREARQKFGQAILIDCHSMPHEAIEALGQSGQRPHVVLGDRFGASANSAIVDSIQAAFEESGFRVARNSPFAGAFTTQHYGRPSQGQHVVQVEIDRSIYMDEARIEPNARFDEIRALISQAIARINRIGRSRRPLAAE